MPRRPRRRETWRKRINAEVPSNGPEHLGSKPRGGVIAPWNDRARARPRPADRARGGAGSRGPRPARRPQRVQCRADRAPLRGVRRARGRSGCRRHRPTSDGKTFCGGADINWMRDSLELSEGRQRQRRCGDVRHAARDRPHAEARHPRASTAPHWPAAPAVRRRRRRRRRTRKRSSVSPRTKLGPHPGGDPRRSSWRRSAIPCAAALPDRRAVRRLAPRKASASCTRSATPTRSTVPSTRSPAKFDDAGPLAIAAGESADPSSARRILRRVARPHRRQADRAPAHDPRSPRRPTRPSLNAAPQRGPAVDSTAFDRQSGEIAFGLRAGARAGDLAGRGVLGTPTSTRCFGG